MSTVVAPTPMNAEAGNCQPGHPHVSRAEHPKNEPSYPTLHTQSVIASEPAGESAFAGHATHADPPVLFRKDPGSHGKHDWDPGVALYWPTWQGLQTSS
eukprot:2802793-Rhodomonas_salina.2